MSPDLMAMMRKRFGGGKGPTSFAPEALPELDYATETPGGGEVQVTRKPLVAHSNAATIGGDDSNERPDILRELSGGLSVDEQQGLNDPRASADAQRARGSFDRMSNIFLNAGGLAPLTPQEDPYVSERDGMRDWVMKRGGVAQRGEANELNADRTGAYLAATKAQQERAASAQALAAEREGRMGDAEKSRSAATAAELERKKLETERDQRNKDRDFELRSKAEAKKKDKSKSGPRGAPKGFPAGWELEGNTTPTPKQGEQFEGLVFSSEKLKGLNGQMREMLKQAGNGRVLPGEAKSRMSQLAKQIQIEAKNVAELGALSGPDFALMEAIAADPTKVDSFMKDMPALLDGLDKWGDNSVNAKSKSLGARRIGSASAPAAKVDDSAALQWAKANPGDPRAAAIMKANGR